MAQINAYLCFNGKCREAMGFYNECLDGELIMQTVAETQPAEHCPAGMENHIMHSMVKKDGALVMATDMVGPEGFIQGNNIALAINCSSEDEINTLFSKFGEGGKIISPLKVEFWGGTFGVLEDKFGIRWMFNYEKKQQA